MFSRNYVWSAAASCLLGLSMNAPANAGAFASVWFEGGPTGQGISASIEAICYGGSDHEEDYWYFAEFHVSCEVTDQSGATFDTDDNGGWMNQYGLNSAYARPNPVVVQSAGGTIRATVITTLTGAFQDEADNEDQCNVGTVAGNGVLGCAA